MRLAGASAWPRELLSDPAERLPGWLHTYAAVRCRLQRLAITPPRCLREAGFGGYRGVVDQTLAIFREAGRRAPRPFGNRSAGGIARPPQYWHQSSCPSPFIIAAFWLRVAFKRPEDPSSDAKLPLSSTGRITFRRLPGRRRLAFDLLRASRSAAIERLPFLQISSGRYPESHRCLGLCAEQSRGHGIPTPPPAYCARDYGVTICANPKFTYSRYNILIVWLTGTRANDGRRSTRALVQSVLLLGPQPERRGGARRRLS